nr:hypothetical protein [Salmonella enterica]
MNNQLKETTELYFKSMTQTLEPCLTKEKLIKYGIVHPGASWVAV